MTPSQGSFVLSRQRSDDLIGEWSLDKNENIVVKLGAKQYRVESGNDMRSQLYSFVRSLESDDLKEPVALKACATCEHFQVSGMSLDMAHGHIGNCALHRFGVRLCHLCKDYSSLDSRVS